MFSTVIRRFSVAAPRFNPPTGSVAKTASSMSPSTSRRVGMMPSKQQTPVNGGGPSSQAGKIQAAHSSDLSDVLAVGNISSHCDGQKISRASDSI